MKLRAGDSVRSFPPVPVNFCAQCGEPLYSASWSEYLDEHRIRHLWNCEDCGYVFETTVSYPLTPKG